MLWLETKIPPPIVMALVGIAALGVKHLVPTYSFELPQRTAIAVAIVGLGVTLNVVPKLAFRRLNTTVNPLRPDLSAHLVTSGIYRYTRNPMYLGHAVMLLGWAIHLHNFAAFLAVPLFVVYVTRFQIEAEERHLATMFGKDYAAFRAKVRRWL